MDLCASTGVAVHKVVLLLILVVGLAEYFAALGWIPDAVKYAQELLAAVVAGYVLIVGVGRNFDNVRGAYWWLFGAITIVLICGLVINAVEPGPIFAGLRNYLRALPFFFLPAVIAFTEKQLRAQLLLLLALCALQLPIALDQRFTSFEREYFSGDRTIGTLGDSGVMSLFLICAASILAGLFIKKRIGILVFVPLFLIVLLPTMINETKGTLILLPIAMLVTFIVGSKRGARVKNSVVAVFLLAMFGALFVPVYDYFMKPRWGYGLAEFVTRQGRVEGYLDRGGGIGSAEAGRVDAARAIIGDLARDPSIAAFGVGSGNASESALGSQFEGRFADRYKPFMQGAANRIVLELGVVGFALVCVLMCFIVLDAIYVARFGSGLVSGVALGWTGVTAAVAFGMFYSDFIPFGIMSFMYWYFAGVIAAERMRLHRAGAHAAR